MMHKTKKGQIEWQLYVLLAVLLAALPATSKTAETSPESWSCETCPAVTGWEWNIDGGIAYLVDDAFRFGDYTGLDDSGAYLMGDVLGHYRGDDSTYMQIEGYARGLDSSAIFFRGGKQSVYEIRASYQSIPRRFFSSTTTPFTGVGSASLLLPAAWVHAPTTGEMTELANVSSPTAIGLDWGVLGLGIDYRPAQRWQMRVDYTRRAREGLQRSSGSFLYNTSEFAAPVDYTTDDIELSANYSADTWQASASYSGSFFSNGNAGLAWDNPYSVPAGVDSGQIALPPDNTSHQVSLAASMLLPARTTLNGQLSFGKLSQNASLLPYTVNPNLATDPLPLNSADASIDTLNVNLRVTTSPWSRVTFEGELRFNDFDNKTSVNDYNYVTTDSALSLVPAVNPAYDYQRRTLKFRAEYRLPGGTKLSAGVENKNIERSRQDRKETRTNRLWLRARSRLGSVGQLTLDLFVDDRDGTDYQVVDKPLATENPLMRKYNMADRQRQGVRLRGSLYAWRRADFGLQLEAGSDDYQNSAIGLTDDEYLRIGADFSFQIGETASVYASIHREEINTSQSNSQSFSEPDWSALTNDTFNMATLGLNYPGLFSVVDASLEYGWSESIGESGSDTSGLPNSFPDLRSQRSNLNLSLSYPYSDSLSLRFDYMFESLDSDDWSLDGVGPDTIPNLLALGANAWNYDANVFFFSVRYRLDAT